MVITHTKRTSVFFIIIIFFFNCPHCCSENPEGIEGEAVGLAPGFGSQVIKG